MAQEEKKCFYCGEEKPKIKRLSFGINKVLVSHLYYSKSNENLYENIKNALIDFNPPTTSKIDVKREYELSVYQIQYILKKIDKFHWAFLLGNPTPPSPLNLLVNYIPVPPLSIRPTVSMGVDKTNEDDLTIKLYEFLK